MLIIYFILIVLFILVLRYKKNNYLAFVVFSIAWVLFAYNYDNADYEMSLILLAIVIVYTLRGFIINSSYFAKVENYSRSSVLGAIVTSSIIVGNYFMMVFIRWKYKKININHPNKTVAVIASDFEIGRKVALAMLLFIPFVFINSMPLRILRFMSLVEIGYLLNYAAILPKRDSRIILALCFLIGLFMFIWVASPALEGLTQNYILDFFL